MYTYVNKYTCKYVDYNRYVCICMYKYVCILIQLVPETEDGFHMIQTQRTGTNMFYEWSLKKRCIR